MKLECKLSKLYGPTEAQPKVTPEPPPPMSLHGHSEAGPQGEPPTMIDAPHQQMIAITGQIEELNKLVIESDKQNKSRSIDILVLCVALAKLRDQNPDSFEALKKGYGVGGAKRGTYNRPGMECRQIVAIALRHQLDRRVISTYGQALAHILTLDVGPKLREEIELLGGLNGCAKAHREYMRDMRRSDEGEPEQSPEDGTEQHGKDEITIETPSKITLYVVDPQGFAAPVAPEIGERMIAEINAHRDQSREAA